MFKVILLVFVLMFHFIKSTFDNQTKCDINDNSCLLAKWNEWLQNAADGGVPECNVPDIDPGLFYNLTASYPSESDPVLVVTLTEGSFIGLQGCEFTHFDLEITTGVGHLWAECSNLRIETQYEFSTLSSPFDSLIGGPAAHGNGNATAEFVNVGFKFLLDVYPYYGSDGKIYLKINKVSYTYTLEKMSLRPSQVIVASRDVTEFADEFINAFWRILNSIFGQIWFDKFVDMYREWSNTLHDCVPAVMYIHGDLPQYLRSS